MKPKVSETAKPPSKPKSQILIQNKDSILKDLSVQKPKDNVSITKEIKKQQIPKQTSNPTQQIVPLQKPIITIPILKTKIPTIKKEEAKISSRTSISSSKSIRTPSQILKSHTIIKQTQPQDLQENQILKTIKINLLKSNDLNSKLKDLESLNKITTEKVTLILNTKFENDKDLVSFSVPITKVASKVTYLKWNLSGSLTDDGSARYIGDILSRFKKAYSIKLKIQAEYFADTAAASLANALKNLKNNLKVFKLDLNVHSYKLVKKLTQIGINKINNSIKMLENLEILHFDRITQESLSHLNNLSNFVYEIPFSQQVKESELEKVVEEFNKSMNLVGNKIVQLEIQNKSYIDESEGKQCYCCTLIDNEQDFESYYLIYINFIKIIKDLPYLTIFNDKYEYNSEDKLNSIKQQQLEQINSYKQILNNLFLEKRLAIIKSKPFYNNILQSLTINPAMVLTDLYIP